MQEFLISLSSDHSYIVYALIIILACAEGPILSMIFGVLIKLGFFSFLPIYVALMVGDLLGDVIWYYIGRRWGHRFVARFGKYFSVTEAGIARVTAIFHRYKHRILFLSKISNGLGFAIVTLITAGLSRIPFWKYLTTNLIGQFVWTGILLAIGYFFGNLYQQVDTWFGRASVAALFVVVFFAFMGYKKYLRVKAEGLTL
jgi:membrane-associated protein